MGRSTPINSWPPRHAGGAAPRAARPPSHGAGLYQPGAGPTGAAFGRSRLELGGLEVNTSLDFDLQNQLTCTLQTQLARAAGRTPPLSADCAAASLLPALPSNFQPLPGGVQGSAVLLDLASGQVLALAGDSTSLRESAGVPGTPLARC